MKTIHKRFYTALPRPLAPSSPSSSTSSTISRVRSNSASSSRSLYTATPSTLPFSFFDSPPVPPPSSRPGSTNLIASTRLVAEVKAEAENQPNSNPGQHNTPQAQGQHVGPPPYPLAFSSSQSESSLSLPASHYNLFFPYSPFGPVSSQQPAVNSGIEAAHPSKRQRTRYHLDVGAYGIPKHSRGSRVAGRDGGVGSSFPSSCRTSGNRSESNAVQVGEDAYFIRGNAMGVADGVGGWSKSRRSGRADEPTPSALFANRLMHYCCEEVDAALPGSADGSPALNGDCEILHDKLEDSLEDLADGLDVLMILEKAFEKTLRAHVVPQSAADEASALDRSRMARESSASKFNTADCTDSSAATCTSSERTSHGNATNQAPLHGISNCPPSVDSCPLPTPLMEGSSTALLAILEHPSASPLKPSKPHSLFHPQVRRPEEAHVQTADRGAVIRIAHLGDCMAVLIRGEEIVWRTEEMWWNFNTPVQLGPASSTRPRDARIFTIPVMEDDILILASDGLSDNLWDEDILDEVVRFRRTFFADSAASPTGDSFCSASLRRGSLAGMLSEALCSRARCVSQRRGSQRKASGLPQKVTLEAQNLEDDIPFGRRAREQGRCFQGGKPDDISVLVAVVSPVD